MRFPVLPLSGIGVLVAAWVVLGRGLFSMLGDYTTLYSMLLGIPIICLHILIGMAVKKTRALGYVTKKRVWIVLSAAWTLFAVLGFTIPDKVDGVTQSILTGDTPGRIGMAIGISNPLGIVGVGMLVATLILALLDTRDPHYNEDDIIDQAEAQGQI